MCEMVRKNKSQGICRAVAIVAVLHLLVLLVSNVSAQLAWSPIQVDSESEYLK
jgi:hypothetical protein